MFTIQRHYGPVAALLAAFTLSVPHAPAQDADFALVHPNAAGFVHVRLAEIWRNESMANVRMILEKAGPKALAALDQQFTPKPSSAERITAVFLAPEPGMSDPQFVVALRFSEPFDPDTVQKLILPNAVKKAVGTRSIFTEPQKEDALYIPDNKTLVFSTTATLESYLRWAPKTDGGLSPALKLAREGKSPLVAAVNIAALPIPPGAKAQVPPDFQPLLKTRLAILTMDFADKATLTLKTTYDTDTAAAAAETALKKAAQMGRAALAMPKTEAEKTLYGKAPKEGARGLEELPEAIGSVFALGAIAYADELLANLPVKQDGSALTAQVTLPAWTTQYFGMGGLSAGLLLSAVQAVREAAARTQSMNNLKMIGLAMHNYHDVRRHFPPQAITDKNGKKLLSWRVAILPYLEQDALYRQFKLDEPWDSEHNLKLSKILPKVYADPRVPAPPGMTYYKVFTGKGTAFPNDGKGLPLTKITDGSSNTIMAVAAGDPVLWTKPDDIPFDADKPLPDLSQPFQFVLALFCDGSVRALDVKSIKPDMLKAAITAAGGEIVNLNE